jgi:hypothetical protein
VAATEGSLKPVYVYTWEVDKLFGDAYHTKKILAKDATLPTFTIAKDTVDGSSLVYKYAGMVTWEDIKITFYDIVLSDSSKASTILKDWRAKVWSAASGLKSPNDYKNDSIITTYTLDWVTKSVWTLHGSWPSTVKEGDLTYTSTDIKVIEVTVSYDWADLDEVAGDSDQIKRYLENRQDRYIPNPNA